ncbi:CDP-glucose 4,6-dehydratase [Nocardiopsis sp. HNM0947]|uniref:CDP-glucose 4,6-dehydratase n=1 Tax=Nocardiopsis coralli TaxID=2772213 RepID=A0ABR9P054_9ACTN|nr:CDP-glucose 4,6-dehydratase [Nocardiopsis coralli]MBE2997219.1 CDP-glucose 4,6-dehydratase [Nocardiopsis coralli]
MVDGSLSGHWRGRSVLVTGHSGFVGSWVCVLLTRLGAEVTGFSLNEDEPTRERGRWLGSFGVSQIVGDVRDYQAVEQAMGARRFDAVLHLAAQPLVHVGISDPRGTLESNVGGTINVLDAARRYPPLVLVLVTSDKCYRNYGGERPYKEGDELGGGCPYSVSKAVAEQVFEAYGRYFPNSGEGTRVASVRFGNVVGGGDHGSRRLVTDYVAALSAGEHPRLRDPSAVRPWQHVLDVCEGLLRLLTRLADGRVPSGRSLNFAPPDGGAPVGRMAEALASAWRAGGGTPLAPVGQEAISGEERVLRLDGSTARRALEWRHRFDVEEMAVSIVSWHRDVFSGSAPEMATSRQVEEFLAQSTIGAHS